MWPGALGVPDMGFDGKQNPQWKIYGEEKSDPSWWTPDRSRSSSWLSLSRDFVLAIISRIHASLVHT